MMATRDPGLQPERTSLAWRRTALAVVFNAILLLRAGLQEQGPHLLALGVILCIGAAAMMNASARRDVELRATARAPTATRMLLVSSLVVLASIGAASVILQ